MKKLKKYTLHNGTGDFMSVKSHNLNTISKECDNYNKRNSNGNYYVSESYLAPSSFNPSKIVEHGKRVYPLK